MSVDIGDVVGTGFRQTFSRNGVVLMAGTYVLAVLNALLTTTIGGSEMAGTAGASLPLSPAVASVLSFGSFVLSLVIGVGAVRAFVENRTASFPRARSPGTSGGRS